MNKHTQTPSTSFVMNIKLEDHADSSVYPFSIPAVKEIESLDFSQPVTFLVGENGSGKSTIIEAIAVEVGFNAEGGTKNTNFETRDTTSPLSQSIRIVQSTRKSSTGYFLRAESFYNFASYIEHLDSPAESGAPIGINYGAIPLHQQSHGESFLALVNNRFGPNGLYILDEPEAALSPERQYSLMIRIRQLVDEGSQFIIATHSPILLAYPQATIFELGHEGITRAHYTETRHYAFTTDFLNNYEAYTKRLGEQH